MFIGFHFTMQVLRNQDESAWLMLMPLSKTRFDTVDVAERSTNGALSRVHDRYGLVGNLYSRSPRATLIGAMVREDTILELCCALMYV